MRLIKLSLSFSLLAMTSACLSAHYVKSDGASRGTRQPFNGLSEHVLLISVDGLRPDAISLFNAETLSRLIREGSYTLQATTILPSKTLPSHTSMLTGQPPDVHRVLWNNVLSVNKGKLQASTVFGALRDEGFATAAFFSKPKFTTLQQPGSLDYSQAPGGWWGQWPADRTLGDALKYLVTDRPNFLFVHFGDTDRAGHDSGWMSSPYGEAVRRVDRAIGTLLTAADQTFGKDRFTVIVTADHGGHDRDHGSDDPRDVTIPWIAWGAGVHPGLLARPVRTTDTASTVLWLFGTEEPGDWQGVPIKEAFTAGVR
jgi:predicted AlkP superfamily pyrophosphatase or phosphodiesterase